MLSYGWSDASYDRRVYESKSFINKGFVEMVIAQRNRTFDVNWDSDKVGGSDSILGFTRVDTRIFASDWEEFQDLLETKDVVCGSTIVVGTT